MAVRLASMRSLRGISWSAYQVQRKPHNPRHPTLFSPVLQFVMPEASPWLPASLPVRSMSHAAESEADGAATAAPEGASDIARQRILRKYGKKSATRTLSKLSEDSEKRLKVLKLEHDVWYSTNRKVPTIVTDEMWLELLRECPTVFSRQKRYRYWLSRESSIHKDELKKEKRRLKRAEENPEGVLTDEKPTLKNTTQLYVREQTMNASYYNNLAYAMMNGPHLVFDCGLENLMNRRELINLVDQLQDAHGFNKRYREAFHFHFCNVDGEGDLLKTLRRGIQSLDEMPITVSAESYLDLYPRDKLVYLSPNSRDSMDEFEPDCVYVIGALVDLAEERSHTYAKAKEENIRTMRLPLDSHLHWKLGSKALTLDQMVRILHEVYKSGDWTKAFTHVPRRKHSGVRGGGTWRR